MPSATPVSGGVDICDVWPLCAQFTSIGEVVSWFLPKVLLLAGIIFFILIVIAGIGVITGAGSDDPHAKEQSRAFLTYAVIGLIIIFGAIWILQIISYLTGGSLKGLF